MTPPLEHLTNGKSQGFPLVSFHHLYGLLMRWFLTPLTPACLTTRYDRWLALDLWEADGWEGSLNSEKLVRPMVKSFFGEAFWLISNI